MTKADKSNEPSGGVQYKKMPPVKGARRTTLKL
jgi:hypothetical protein